MTLTEQWKNDKLQNDWYYVRTTNGIEKLEYIKQSHGFGYYETEWVLEVLAPVPSYEEYMSLVFYKEDLTKVCKMKDKIIKKYEDTDDWWKKENQQLKELLKDCLNEIHELAEIQDNRSVTIYNFLSAELITKIDNAIGEK